LPRCSAKNPRLFSYFISLFKDYDIINLHTYSPWAVLAAGLLRKRVVYTFHGAFGFRARWTDSLKKQFYRAVVNRLSDRIVFATETSLSIYQNRIGSVLPDKKIALFPLGLQIEKIKSVRTKKELRRALGLDNRFLVGTVTRIDPVKKIERLIEAFSQIAHDKSFHLLIVGNGDGDYQKRLSGLVENEGYKDSVDFLGYREDVYDIVNALDFFILPSARETFGLALLEAMALGIPSAVFTDGGGALDVLGDTGYVVESPRQLAEVILRIREDDRLRESLSGPLKRRAGQFDIRRTAEMYHLLYQELMQKINCQT
jgi:glycosyltransferase involved in cell wall biosynthesis